MTYLKVMQLSCNYQKYKEYQLFHLSKMKVNKKQRLEKLG